MNALMYSSTVIFLAIYGNQTIVTIFQLNVI